MHHKNLTALLIALLSQLVPGPAVLAAEPAVAGETRKVATEAAAINKELAAQAVYEATRQAIESVKADTKLDLDIRLIGPTSVIVARKK
jgi:hypothetical protein